MKKASIKSVHLERNEMQYSVSFWSTWQVIITENIYESNGKVTFELLKHTLIPDATMCTKIFLHYFNVKIVMLNSVLQPFLVVIHITRVSLHSSFTRARYKCHSSGVVGF